jgi:hypothetical protein
LIGASAARFADIAATRRLAIVARHLALAGRPKVRPVATRKICRHG